jgi:hypothetical protein
MATPNPCPVLQVVVVFTHSGTTRSILLAMGREPYRPQNTELVPAIVTFADRQPLEDILRQVEEQR